MAWTLAGQRIYVEQDTAWQHTPRIGEVNVLDSEETILHYAGRPSYTRQIVFVVFSGYGTNILPITSGILVSDQCNEGQVVVKSCKGTRLFDTSRTTSVVRVTMELLKAGS